MTISSSLNAGVSGLTANSTRLSAISDNIANASTFGYKRVETDFRSLVIGEGGGAYTAGGVRAETYRLVGERGALVGSQNGTDLAVRGRGFLPVTNATEVQAGTGDHTMMLTSTGSFRTDADGFLRSESGLVLMGWPAEPDGTFLTYPRDTASGLEPIRIPTGELVGLPSTQVDLGINLPTTDNVNPALVPYQLALEYYDHFGATRSLNASFAPTGNPNEWNMSLTDPTGTVHGPYTYQFDPSATNGGALQSGPTPTISIDYGGGHVQSLNVFPGTAGERDGLTQIGSTFAPVDIDRDGYPVSTMMSVEIDETGFVYGVFDNGARQVLYQIPLANVNNPKDMEALDRQVFIPTPASGGFVLWNAGSGPVGEVVPFAREESTTDVAAELTEMIITQRAYSSNAKVITTVDEMLQETTNMKR